MQTVETVFVRHALPKGEITHRGQRVDLAAIRNAGLLSVEGEKDDISGVGQTCAANELCVNIPESRKHYYLAEGVGHYGVFNGSRFRKEIAPRIRKFIAGIEAGAKPAKPSKTNGAGRPRGSWIPAFAGITGWRLEIARQTLHLPVAIAYGIEAAAAIELAWAGRFELG